MKNNYSFYFLKQEPKIKIETGSPLLLMLHGYGSNEEDLFSLAEGLDSRFLICSLRAPIVRSYASYCWFEVDDTRNPINIDLVQGKISSELILKFIEEISGEYKIDKSKIFLMGFSQGGIISLHTAFTNPDKLKYIAVLSGKLSKLTVEKITRFEEIKNLKIFMSHGVQDEVIKISNSRESKELLEKLNVELFYKEYNSGHNIDYENFNDLKNWLTLNLNSKS